MSITGGVISGNSASWGEEPTQGGGLMVMSGTYGVLTSTRSDWDVDPDDNSPEDLHSYSGEVGIAGYGAEETFTCSDAIGSGLFSCDPLPE
jgi:hypothetical protein